MSDPFSQPASAREVLESWKEIAAYLGRSVRAVQLWEKEENLPVHRHRHDKQGTVFAYRDEIDRWRDSRTATPATPPPVTLVFPAPPAKPPRRGVQIIAAGVLAAAVLVTLAVVLWRRGTTGDAVPIRSIAVLPFTSSARGDIEHVSDGLTEMLIDELAATPDLRVMARSSVFQYKGRSVSPSRAGKELDVGAVVTGDVRRESDRYAVRVELIDARDGAQLWARRYEIQPGELPSIQHRIFGDLSSRLRGRAAPVAAKYTTNAEAYEQYLLGLRDWNRRSGAGMKVRDMLQSARAHFERAIELDPQYAAAYAGLANTYGVMVGLNVIPPAEGTMHIFAAARKALELDPNNAEAYTSLATTSFRSLRDFGAAERDYRRAIALNPNFATAHQWYSRYLQAMGRFDEARQEIDLAYRLDPLSGPITADKCESLWYERRYEEVIRFGNEVEARDPSRTPVLCVSNAMFTLGDFEGLFRYRETRAPGPIPAAVLDAYRRGGARALHAARLQNLLKRPNTPALVLARAYALAGNADQAFAWLETSLQRNESDITTFHIEPALDSLRTDPRFAQLARRVGIPSSVVEAANALAASRR